MTGDKDLFLVDSKGHCFLCLSKDSPIEDCLGPEEPELGATSSSTASLSSIYSLQYLSRHLKMDLLGALNANLEGRTPIPPRMAARMAKSEMRVKLCEECIGFAERFSKMYPQLEEVRGRVATALKLFQRKLNSAEGNGKAEEFRRMRDLLESEGEGGGLLGRTLDIVGTLRMEVLRKCSQELSGNGGTHPPPAEKVDKHTMTESEVGVGNLQTDASPPPAAVPADKVDKQTMTEVEEHVEVLEMNEDDDREQTTQEEWTGNEVQDQPMTEIGQVKVEYSYYETEPADADVYGGGRDWDWETLGQGQYSVESEEDTGNMRIIAVTSLNSVTTGDSPIAIANSNTEMEFEEEGDNSPCDNELADTDLESGGHGMEGSSMAIEYDADASGPDGLVEDEDGWELTDGMGYSNDSVVSNLQTLTVHRSPGSSPKRKKTSSKKSQDRVQNSGGQKKQRAQKLKPLQVKKIKTKHPCYKCKKKFTDLGKLQEHEETHEDDLDLASPVSDSESSNDEDQQQADPRNNDGTVARVKHGLAARKGRKISNASSGSRVQSNEPIPLATDEVDEADGMPVLEPEGNVSPLNTVTRTALEKEVRIPPMHMIANDGTSALKTGLRRKYRCRYPKCLRTFLDSRKLDKHQKESHDYSSSTDNTPSVHSQNSEDNAEGENEVVSRASPSIPICVVFSSGPQQFKNSILKEKRLFDPNTKKYSCRDCSKKMSSLHGFLDHYRSQHLNIWNKCSVCGKQSASRYRMNRHQSAIHKGTKFQCGHCTQIFPLESRLITHRKGNRCDPTTPPTTDEPMEGKTAHRRFNPETGKYECTVCSKEFTSSHATSGHYQSVHLKRKLKCSGCAKEFTLRSSLRCHYKIAHMGVKLKCLGCDKMFNYKVSLKIHQQKTGCVGSG